MNEWKRENQEENKAIDGLKKVEPLTKEEEREGRGR